MPWAMAERSGRFTRGRRYDALAEPLGTGKNKKGENHFLLFHFPQPPFFPQQSFTCFPPIIEYSRKNTMVVGKQVKDCTGKKWGVGENEKRRMVFPLPIFSPNPQFLYRGIYCAFQSFPPPWEIIKVFNLKRWVFTPFERAFRQSVGFVKIGHTL